MLRRTKCAGLGILGVMAAGPAGAAVIANWDVGTPVTNGAFSGTRYVLTLTSDQGPISAIDMKLIATTKFYNEQYREGRIFQAGPATSYDVDTLFLFPAAGLTVVTQGEHDTTPADPGMEYTSDLYAAFSFTGGVGEFTSAPVAQVIVPAGAPVPTLAMLYNTNDAMNVSYVVAGGAKVAVPVPEPSVFVMLGIAGAGLLRRRQRRQ